MTFFSSLLLYFFILKIFSHFTQQHKKAIKINPSITNTIGINHGFKTSFVMSIGSVNGNVDCGVVDVNEEVVDGVCDIIVEEDNVDNVLVSINLLILYGDIFSVLVVSIGIMNELD